MIKQPAKFADAKKKKNRADYMFVNRSNEFLHKPPGSLEGSQFKLESCNSCEIYIEDNNAGGFVDLCK